MNYPPFLEEVQFQMNGLKENDTLMSQNNSINNTPMKTETPFHFRKMGGYNLTSPFKMQKESDVYRTFDCGETPSGAYQQNFDLFHDDSSTKNHDSNLSNLTRINHDHALGMSKSPLNIHQFMGNSQQSLESNDTPFKAPYDKHSPKGLPSLSNILRRND